MSTTERRPFAGLTLLLVDDHDDMRSATAFLFEALGASVVMAASGAEALERLPDAAPQLILCDLRMPEMDGFQFVRRLRDTPEWAGLPVVALSAYRDVAIEAHARSAGFDAHLMKPFNTPAVVAAVREAMARYSSSS